VTNRDFFTQRVKSEHAGFLKVFRAVPAAQLTWRPHPQSRSAEELLSHLIGHEAALAELVMTGKIDYHDLPFKSLGEGEELYRIAHAQLLSALSRPDDDAWDGGKGQFIINGTVAYEAPPRDLAWLLFFDSIHHRGQLSTYLRPMGAKVPSIYGPSADDPGGD
jgi:uncharacterized damage-inducible protein DinB